MSRDKQIEEMAKLLKGMDRFDEAKFGFYESYARAIYNAGYRKASEVAEEIFAEIDRYYAENVYLLMDMPSFIAELKKKYTEERK